MQNNCHIKTVLTHLKDSPHTYEYKELKTWSERLTSKHSVTRHFARAILLANCHPNALPSLDMPSISKQAWTDLVANLEASLLRSKRRNQGVDN
jgi:hypothetical protein